MATKRVEKRVAPKGTSKKIAVSKKKIVVGTPVTEVFSTQPPEQEEVQVPANSVVLYINGRSKGTIDTNRQKLGEFVTTHAQNAGIRTFSVYVDGNKIDTSDATKLMTGFSKVEIVAKDSRG